MQAGRFEPVGILLNKNMNTEYNYEEQLPADKNIALALFAIANELSKLSENKSEQSLDLKNTLKKELSEIANKITFLYETVKSIYSANEKDEVSEKTMTNRIVEQLNNISDRLDYIGKQINR